MMTKVLKCSPKEYYETDHFMLEMFEEFYNLDIKQEMLDNKRANQKQNLLNKIKQ